MASGSQREPGADPALLIRVARQLVFGESGRGVETTIVDGGIVMRDRRLLTIDEAAPPITRRRRTALPPTSG